MYTKEYYESEGIRLMELGNDDEARSFLARAAELGSGRARLCLQYLDLNVRDEDFTKQSAPETVFDYDLQPLRRVSRVRVEGRKALRHVRNTVSYLADDVEWMIRGAYKTLAGSLALPR